MTARQAISATSSRDGGRSRLPAGATRLPLLDHLYGIEWADKILHTLLAPKGKKRVREAELKAYVTDRLKAAMPAKEAA